MGFENGLLIILYHFYVINAISLFCLDFALFTGAEAGKGENISKK